MLKVCGRLKGLIPRECLILPQSRESAEVRAQPYSSGAHRPCSARAITIYRKEISFTIGNEIFINVKNFRVRKLCKKLTDRYVEPFKMSKFVNFNVYELELSEIYERFYRTFLISLLESYSRREGEEPPGSIDFDKKDKF